MNSFLENIISSDLNFEYIHGGISKPYDEPLQRPWVIRPFDVISFAIKGCMEFHVQDDKLFLKEGQGIFIPSGQLRRSILTPANGLNIIRYLNFSYTCLGLVNFLSLFSIPGVFKGEQARKLKELLINMEIIDNKSDITGIRRKIKIKELSFAMLDILMENAVIQEAKGNILCRHSRLSKLLVELKRNPEAVKTVSEMAEIVGVSTSCLHQLFKELTGYPPVEYVRIQRLKKGMQLLLTTDLSIAEISEELKFPDQFCFSKSYKKLFGLSPSFYRQKNRLWE